MTVTVHLTVDLRRYLPDREKGAICNLSVMQVIAISYDSTELFNETISKVLVETRKRKSDNPGIKGAFLYK